MKIKDNTEKTRELFINIFNKAFHILYISYYSLNDLLNKHKDTLMLSLDDKFNELDNTYINNDALEHAFFIIDEIASNNYNSKITSIPLEMLNYYFNIMLNKIYFRISLDFICDKIGTEISEVIDRDIQKLMNRFEKISNQS